MSVRIEQRGSVLTVVLNRPEARNAVPLSDAAQESLAAHGIPVRARHGTKRRHEGTSEVGVGRHIKRLSSAFESVEEVEGIGFGRQAGLVPSVELFKVLVRAAIALDLRPATDVLTLSLEGEVRQIALHEQHVPASLVLREELRPCGLSF